MHWYRIGADTATFKRKEGVETDKQEPMRILPSNYVTEKVFLMYTDIRILMYHDISHGTQTVKKNGNHESEVFRLKENCIKTHNASNRQIISAAR